MYTHAIIDTLTVAQSPRSVPVLGATQLDFPLNSYSTRAFGLYIYKPNHTCQTPPPHATHALCISLSGPARHVDGLCAKFTFPLQQYGYIQHIVYFTFTTSLGYVVAGGWLGARPAEGAHHNFDGGYLGGPSTVCVTHIFLTLYTKPKAAQPPIYTGICIYTYVVCIRSRNKMGKCSATAPNW